MLTVRWALTGGRTLDNAAEETEQVNESAESTVFSVEKFASQAEQFGFGFVFCLLVLTIGLMMIYLAAESGGDGDFTLLVLVGGMVLTVYGLYAACGIVFRFVGWLVGSHIEEMRKLHLPEGS